MTENTALLYPQRLVYLLSPQKTVSPHLVNKSFIIPLLSYTIYIKKKPLSLLSLVEKERRKSRKRRGSKSITAYQ